MDVARDVTSGDVRRVAAPESVHGLRVAPATSSGTPVPTLVQPHPDGVAVLTVLSAGQRTVDYPDALEPGQRLEPADDGALVVLEGEDVVGAVEAPWAVDATGRRLPTRYELRGRRRHPPGGRHGRRDVPGRGRPQVLRRLVPRPRLLPGAVLVRHVEGQAPDGPVRQAGLGLVSAICAKIPSAPAKAACAYTVNHRYATYRKQVNSGIAHKRCVKIRNGFGPTDLWAWGIWTKKCIK